MAWGRNRSQTWTVRAPNNPEFRRTMSNWFRDIPSNRRFQNKKLNTHWWARTDDYAQSTFCSLLFDNLVYRTYQLLISWGATKGEAFGFMLKCKAWVYEADLKSYELSQNQSRLVTMYQLELVVILLFRNFLYYLSYSSGTSTDYKYSSSPISSLFCLGFGPRPIILVPRFHPTPPESLIKIPTVRHRVSLKFSISGYREMFRKPASERVYICKRDSWRRSWLCRAMGG